MLAHLEVGGLVLVVIGLLLKRDVAIGIAFEWQSDEPLEAVEDVKEDEAQFTHLCRVYALMIDERLVGKDAIAHHNEPEKVDCGEALEGDAFAPENLHASCHNS